MPADLRVTVDGKAYEVEIEVVLEDLTGDETLAIEDFLGGWQNFDAKGGSARSVYVLYYLAKRANDPNVKLADVLKEKGVLFGDRVELEDLEGDEPRPPAEGGETPSTEPAPSDDSGPGISPSDTE